MYIFFGTRVSVRFVTITRFSPDGFPSRGKKGEIVFPFYSPTFFAIFVRIVEFRNSCVVHKYLVEFGLFDSRFVSENQLWANNEFSLIARSK